MVTGLVEARMKFQYEDRCSRGGSSQSKVTVVHHSTEDPHQLTNVPSAVNDVEPEPILVEFLEEWDAVTEEANLDFNDVDADLSDHMSLGVIFKSGIHEPDVAVIN